eukprot:Sspe_Gene.16724::Locus_5907_Transcript_1_1_Confidence_1.000_Length_2724::g.16724::m.16724
MRALRDFLRPSIPRARRVRIMEDRCLSASTALTIAAKATPRPSCPLPTRCSARRAASYRCRAPASCSRFLVYRSHSTSRASRAMRRSSRCLQWYQSTSAARRRSLSSLRRFVAFAASVRRDQNLCIADAAACFHAATEVKVRGCDVPACRAQAGETTRRGLEVSAWGDGGPLLEAAGVPSSHGWDGHGCASRDVSNSWCTALHRTRKKRCRRLTAQSTLTSQIGGSSSSSTSSTSSSSSPPTASSSPSSTSSSSPSSPSSSSSSLSSSSCLIISFKSIPCRVPAGVAGSEPGGLMEGVSGEIRWRKWMGDDSEATAVAPALAGGAVMVRANAEWVVSRTSGEWEALDAKGKTVLAPMIWLEDT